MEFKLREKYNIAAELAMKIADRSIEIVIDVSFATYEFAANLKTDEGRKENWELIKRRSVDFAKIIMEEGKKILKDIADNWEAVVILTLASVGLSHIIGEFPTFIMLPAFFESTMVVPVMSVIIILILVTLLEKKIGDDNETAGERVGQRQRPLSMG